MVYVTVTHLSIVSPILNTPSLYPGDPPKSLPYISLLSRMAQLYRNDINIA